MPEDSQRSDPEFPVPSRAAWRAEVEASLRGAPYDALRWQLGCGDEPLDPLATRADADGLAHRTANASSWLRRESPWRSRELITSPDPADAAIAARDALADGVDEVEFCLDQLVQDALEPSDEESPGVSGVAVHDLAAMRALLEHVDPARTRIAFAAGEGALGALAAVLAIAAERGAPIRDWQIDLDVDPLARLTQRQAEFADVTELEGAATRSPEVISHRADVESVFDECAAIVRQCAAHCPRVRPLAIDGQTFHLAGGSPTLEIAATLAIFAETARQLLRRGISIATLCDAITVRLQASHELLTEIAKLRALRLLWVKLANLTHAPTEQLAPRVLAVTSGRARSYRHDVRTNVLRTSLAAFAAIAGGCDGLVIVPFDEDPARQDAAARRLARHQHFLLRDEAQLAAVTDPAGGAYALEVLTDRIARSAWRRFQEIEAAGGIVAMLQDGSLDALHVESAVARQAEFATRRRTLVGINRFVDRELEGAAQDGERAWDRAVERVGKATAARLAARDEAAVERTIAAIDPLRDDLLAQATNAARTGATLGEISRATWPAAGVSFRHRFLPLACPDGEAFEELRDAADEGPRPTLQILRLDASRTAARRVELARAVFATAGWDLAEGDDLTVDDGADAVAVCGDGEAWRNARRSLPPELPIIAIVDPPPASSPAGSLESPGHRRPDGVLFLHEVSDLVELFDELIMGGKHEH